MKTTITAMFCLALSAPAFATTSQLPSTKTLQRLYQNADMSGQWTPSKVKLTGPAKAAAKNMKQVGKGLGLDGNPHAVSLIDDSQAAKTTVGIIMATEYGSFVTVVKKTASGKTANQVITAGNSSNPTETWKWTAK